MNKQFYPLRVLQSWEDPPEIQNPRFVWRAQKYWRATELPLTTLGIVNQIIFAILLNKYKEETPYNLLSCNKRSTEMA